MKFIYFVIIIVIIYFVATQIQLIHIDSLPEEKKVELKTKNDMRSLLLDNHITEKKEHFEDSATFGTNDLIGRTDKYSSQQYDSRDYKDNYWDLTENKFHLPNGNNLYFLIRSEYRDQEFKFNISNQPVTTRNPNGESEASDRQYLKQVRKNIMRWNDLFPKYYDTKKKLIKISSIKLIYVQETLNEFYIKVNVSLDYLGKTMHFELTYYGQIYRNDDFLRGASDTYVLQLIDIKPITKSEYDTQPEMMTQKSQFMSMQQQMEYVDKINKLHQEDSKY